MDYEELFVINIHEEQQPYNLLNLISNQINVFQNVRLPFKTAALWHFLVTSLGNKTLPVIHFVNFLTPYHVASYLTHIHQVLLYTRHIETGKVRLSLYMSQRHLLTVQVQLASLLNSELAGCE